MAFGSVNVPGAELEERMASVERAISSSTGAQGQPNGVATLDNTGKVPETQLPPLAPFIAQASAPADRTKLWIDTTANTGGLKYWNGTAWVHVPMSTV